MQIHFDTNSPRELTAVAALIAVLRAGNDYRSAATAASDAVLSPASAGTLTSVAAAIMPEVRDAEARVDAALTPVDHSDQDADIVPPPPATADSANVPYDPRIHSESKAVNADGTWRKRRNVPQDQYDAVMAELRAGHDGSVADHQAAMGAPDPTLSVSPEPMPAPAPPAPSAPVATETLAVAVAPAAEAVAPPPPPATGARPPMTTFPEFVSAVNGKDVLATSKTYDALNALCKTIGVEGFRFMKDHPDKWELFYDMVEA